jgi:hypothetical protein
MTNDQIDRLLDGDPSFGIIPLVAAKAIKDVITTKGAAPPATSVIVVPSEPTAPQGSGLLPVLAVALLGLGAGAGIGYMFSQRS